MLGYDRSKFLEKWRNIPQSRLYLIDSSGSILVLWVHLLHGLNIHVIFATAPISRQLIKIDTILVFAWHYVYPLFLVTSLTYTSSLLNALRHCSVQTGLFLSRPHWWLAKLHTVVHSIAVLVSLWQNTHQPIFFRLLFLYCLLVLLQWAFELIH